MSKITIIPAIDLIDGKCVRLSQGDYTQKKVYNESPLEVAKAFEDAGIKRLHLVDLDGAKANHIVNHKVLETIASKTSLLIDFGGGLKSDADLHVAFESGAQMITGGSIAVKQPEVFLSWLNKYGAERIILGADVKDKMIAWNGWQEVSAWSLIDFLKDYVQKGVTQVISTDISTDGMLLGPNIDLYAEMQQHLPQLHIIASGGVSGMKDIEKLNEMGIQGVIAGKAIYENRISLNDISRFIAAN